MKEFLTKITVEHALKDEKGDLVITTFENGRQELTFPDELERKAYLDKYNEFANKTFELNF